MCVPPVFGQGSRFLLRACLAHHHALSLVLSLGDSKTQLEPAQPRFPRLFTGALYSTTLAIAAFLARSLASAVPSSTVAYSPWPTSRHECGQPVTSELQSGHRILSVMPEYMPSAQRKSNRHNLDNLCASVAHKAAPFETICIAFATVL